MAFQPSTNTKSKTSNQEDDDALVGVVFILIIIGIGFLIYFCYRMISNRCRNTNTNNNYPNHKVPYHRGVNPQFSNPNPYPHNQQIITPPINPATLPPNPYLTDGRFNQLCDLCGTQSKLGEEARVLINCSSQHFFHLTCIADHIKGVKFNCPCCGQGNLGQIALFCCICKVNHIVVNISEFIELPGQLNINRLRNNYGDYCPQCSN